MAYSVAGDVAPERAVVSVVATLGYGGFLLGPPLASGLVGLRSALGIIALAGLAVFALSLHLRKMA